MADGSYFWFDDDDKVKSKYSHNQQKRIGKLKTHSPIDIFAFGD